MSSWRSAGVMKDRDKFIFLPVPYYGARVSVVVKALYYKPEGRGFEAR
jgi:hypothetical protein